MLRPFESFTVVPALPPELELLSELAYNLRWAWDRDSIDLFRRLDQDLWEETGHNPVLMLGKVSQTRLEAVAKDRGFTAHLGRVYRSLAQYLDDNGIWFRNRYPSVPDDLSIAYFSMEYGITDCLPIYSGGLGVLSGDYLKSASDLGVPLVGVGLLYQEGYFRQYLNADGWQGELYLDNDFHNLPIRLKRDEQGHPLIIEVAYPGRIVKAQVWHVQVGRVPLFMLDTNIDANRPEDRVITNRLYGGDADMRIRQEIMLGIGGVRALKALGIEPTVCHMNEGHSAFQALERIRLAMKEYDLSFAEARELVTAGNIFTTHTAVPAGFDLFSPDLMEHYFGAFRQELGLDREAFLRLGRSPRGNDSEAFSMATLAITLSAYVNGVSRLHGRIARRLFQNLWPGLPEEEVPITSIANGVHHRSWVSQDIASLLVRYLGPSWLESPQDPETWRRIERIPDDELWQTHERRRERLVSVARRRLTTQLERRGATPREIEQAAGSLDPEALTIGFARRFATYKRALLLLRDPDRLAQILNAPGKPVQIIFAGKAHPDDNPAKEYMRRLIHIIRRDDLRQRVIFLEDYDMNLARYLVQGVDVWLNTPRVGQEASGTSGMKAAFNGALHLSTFDGWWAEGYSPEIGWRIGHGEIYEDEEYGDEVEAQALYDLLEKDVIPLFYDRGRDGLPHGWIAKMKRSMANIGVHFNTHRMLTEYFEGLYLPAIEQHNRLKANNAEGAREVASWRAQVERAWPTVRIVSIESDAHDGISVRDEVTIHARIYLSELQPDDVTVQACLGNVAPDGALRDYYVIDMSSVGRDESGAYIYKVTTRFNNSGQNGYTVRVMPKRIEMPTIYLPGLVLWAN